jgi:PAS domain S-box-containing protein
MHEDESKNSPDSEALIRELKNRNEELSRQIVRLMQNKNQGALVADGSRHKMVEFIQRISRRLESEELFSTMTEEFLRELGADRVTLLLQGGGKQKTLVTSYQACQKNISEVPVPYFISLDPSDPYRQFLDLVVNSGKVRSAVWDFSIEIHPDIHIRAACARSFLVEGAGLSVICLQWVSSPPAWTLKEAALFSDMVDYASVLVEQHQLLSGFKELKEQTESIIQSMPSAIIGLDFLGSITMWNGQAERWFGFSEEEVIGHLLQDRVPELSHLSKDLMKVLESTEEELVFEPVEYQSYGLKKRILQPHLFNMISSDRGEIALRLDDITRQRDLQKQLVQAQKMETVGSLAGGLASDFNEILSRVTKTIQSLRQRWNSKDQKYVIQDADKYDLEILDQNGQKAIDLVNRLLKLSNNSEFSSTAYNLSDCLSGIAVLLEGTFEHQIDLRLNLQSPEAWVQGDPNQMESAIINLCLNSRDAMPNGGILNLSLKEFFADSDFSEKHSCADGARFWLVEVQDNGEGIPEAIKDRIFDAFFSTKTKEYGTGLGMSLVEMSVQQHRGIIEFKSVVASGTLFQIYLPPVLAPSPLYNKLVKQHPAIHALTILVVDDDPAVCKIATGILHESGHLVHTAKDGPEAVRLFNDDKYDLIILDADMPGMNGLDTFRILRQIVPNQKIMFTSTKLFTHDLSAYLDKKMCSILEKPYNFEQLSSAVFKMFK